MYIEIKNNKTLYVNTLRQKRVKLKKQIAAYYPDQQQYILGLTNYIWEHAFKLQFEAAYDRFKDNQTLSVKDNFYLRFQIEMGI